MSDEERRKPEPGEIEELIADLAAAARKAGIGQRSYGNDKYILDSEHNLVPIPDGEHGLLIWGAWMENVPNRIVKQEWISRRQVSTVFLGFDHGFSGLLSGEPSPPVVFETMIFEYDPNPPNPLGLELLARDKRSAMDYQTRCSTWDEALAMHSAAVEYALKLDEAPANE